MATFIIGKDIESAESAGAGGMFQVHTIIDEYDNDITDKIDVGRFFNDEDEFKEYLSEVLNISQEEIDFEDW